MGFFLDLFSPETYNTFSHSDRAISGFRRRHTKAASRIETGDKLVCYMTKLSRWVGLLEVVEGPYFDDSLSSIRRTIHLSFGSVSAQLFGCRLRRLFLFTKTKFGINSHLRGDKHEARLPGRAAFAPAWCN
jgi:hypothetical protein